MKVRRSVLTLLVVAALAATALPAAAGASDDATPPPDSVRNVLVPGQSGAIPPDAHSTDQIRLYDGLTPLFDQVTASDVERHFKPETLGDRSGTPEPTPRPGLTILRDEYGVPKIFGSTRADTEFGAGWVAAHDRSFILEVLRGPARIAALDVPGLDAFSLAQSGRGFDPSPQTEQFLADQVQAGLREGGADGRKLLADVDAYVAGINAYYAQTHNPAKPWTRNDVVAATSLIGAVFGRGGGNEVSNAEILAALRGRLGEVAGTQVFRDLREVNDPEAPTTIANRFPYEATPLGPTPGSAVVDAGSVQQVSALTPHRHMSNALLVRGDRSASGDPLAVMGPQVGYYYPEILMEMELHGGGLDARGATFPGTSLYVELGRGQRYAWSATSSGSDNVDQFLEELCNPDGTLPTRDSDHYLYRGRCIPMSTFDAGVLHGGDHGDQDVSFRQTVHGPVSGTATVGGKSYAITTMRSTRGREPMSGLGFIALNENRADSPAAFQRAASRIEFTFNWLYVNGKHVSYYSSGRLPRRAPGTDPSLPTLGTGRWDWRGTLPFGAHPRATDPAPGTILSWNNKPAPGFGAADDNWTYGAVDHVQLFAPFAEHDNRIEGVVSLMNKAATQDDFATLVWPVIARVLAGGPAPDEQAQRAFDAMNTWVAQGASRLDRDGDGFVDAPGAPVSDGIQAGVLGAVFGPVLGDLTGMLPQAGMPSWVSKDLRTILDEPVRGRFSRVYCGSGDLAACRASLWELVRGVAEPLGPDPSTWRAPAGRTSFVPGILPNTIQDTNRPTFQQVVELHG